METLTASGVDIIGMTGNHQNDYGLRNALGSLDFYDEHDLPVYGGGRTLDEAHRPLSSSTTATAWLFSAPTATARDGLGDGHDCRAARPST
jgi:hypothetical protein